MDDATTFFLAFAAVFLGIAALLWHLERRAKALELRLATVEAATAKAKGPAAPARPKA
ncbi:MAG: CcmD family protein [Candidatus Thermoplasmatota archaeon]